MPKIKINNIEMYYEIHGKGEPIVFVSGFSADNLTWTPILDQFSQHYQVILLDNRGAGQTDTPHGSYTILQMAKDVVDLCDALHIQKAHFVGSSMGGHIVQTIAHEFPKLVKSLIISNSAMKPETPFLFYLKAHFELMKANAPVESLIKGMLSWAFSYDYLSKPDMLENLIRLAKNNPHPMTLTALESQYAALIQFNSTKWAHKINAPTLVITSNQDVIFSTDISKALVSQITNAKYHCFENCGHLPHIEQPEKFCKAVMDFLIRINGVNFEEK